MLKSLAVGQDGENRVINLFKTIGYDVISQSTKTHDLHCTSLNFLIEVKNDIYAARSGNIALEVHNSRQDKPSGLTATTADFWAHIAFSKIHLIPVAKLKDWVAKNTPVRIIEKGGDNNARLLLFKYDDIKSIFLHEDDFSKDSFDELYNSISNKRGR